MVKHRVRRVIMGESAPGESFTRVEEIPPQLYGDAGTTIYPIWGWDGIQTVPHSGIGRPPAYEGELYTDGHYMPAPGGVSIGASTFAAEDQSLEDALTGMHRSDSVDIAVIVSGEVTVIATDGTETVLRQGDVYVQNGALHAWRTNPVDPAHVVFINVGAHGPHDAVPPHE